MDLSGKEREARRRVCLPLDGLPSLDDVRARVEELSPVVGMFKVGKESYTRFGPSVVGMVHDYGSDVFLDLKYHDIPNTVRGAARAASELGVSMFNVHASGGSAMLEAAVEGARAGADAYGMEVPKVLGVTVLTSIDRAVLNEEVRVEGSVEDHVRHLAELSHRAGLDGIVCSAADLYATRDALPDGFLYVTPGIKGPSTTAGADQKRVFTPGNAIEDGASILVVGRAITGAETPDGRVRAGYSVLQDMALRL